MEGEMEFVKRVLHYATRLKRKRVKIRKEEGKQSTKSQVHSAKLNVLQDVLSIFDRTVCDIERVKCAIADSGVVLTEADPCP